MPSQASPPRLSLRPPQPLWSTRKPCLQIRLPDWAQFRPLNGRARGRSSAYFLEILAFSSILPSSKLWRTPIGFAPLPTSGSFIGVPELSTKTYAFRRIVAPKLFFASIQNFTSQDPFLFLKALPLFSHVITPKLAECRETAHRQKIPAADIVVAWSNWPANGQHRGFPRGSASR